MSSNPKITQSSYDLAKKLISIYYPISKSNNENIEKHSRIVGGTDYEKFDKLAVEIEREDILSRKDILNMLNPNDYKIQRQMFEGSAKPKIEICLIFKNQGDYFIKQSLYDEAINSYEKSLLQLFYNFNDVEEEKKQVEKIKLSINLNLSLCLMKKEKYYEAIGYLKEAKRLDNNNLKIFYRLSHCNIKLNNLDEAREIAKEALKIDKNNKEFQNLLNEIDEIEKKQFKQKGKILKKII
jgi:tetratricopeptide (TPR) repeat protein